ncbi:MAG: hypothetical protein ABWK01_06465 [Infirmifilum sp.]
MKPVGELFRSKVSLEELKEELVPSFDAVLEAWMSGPKRTKFSDPDYVLEITYVTPPLKLFVERVAERLRIPNVVGVPLERGFGFGKTHSLIYLWHLFTSDAYRKAGITIPEDLVQETLVLGMDFSADHPFARLVQELEFYAKFPKELSGIKDVNLLRAVLNTFNMFEKSENLADPESLAKFISKVLEEYERLGGKPKLLLLMDELGLDLARKLREYADKKDDKIYTLANKPLNFLSYLYSKLQVKKFAGVVIWALAEQDKREIEALAMKYVDDEKLSKKIEGVIKDLDTISERYSRGLGGTSIAELSYSPEYALDIARRRLLKVAPGVSLENLQAEYVHWLEALAKQLNLSEAFFKYREELKRFYPFSLGLINLLKKLMSSRDAPRTEFVRTVLQVACEATENALRKDPEGAYALSVKHLSMGSVVQAKLVTPFEEDWVRVAMEVEDAVGKQEQEMKVVAELVAKYILAKGITADVLTLLESKEKRDVERYGSTLEEIQLEVLTSMKGDEALVAIERLGNALEILRSESARIDEREVESAKFYVPSLVRTVFNKLAVYILEERKNVEKEELIPVYLVQRGTLQSLFTNLSLVIGGRSNVNVSLTEYRKLVNLNLLLSDESFRDAQNRGNLLLVLVPPWDAALFFSLRQGESYDTVVNRVVRELQAALQEGRVKKPLHLVVLVPNLSVTNMKRLLSKLVEYEGTKRFINYLAKKEEIINERLKEYEATLVKRGDLIEFLRGDDAKRVQRNLRTRLESEIVEARNYAQQRLVRLSREIVKSVLELYEKVVYYSLDEKSFTAKHVSSIQRPEEAIEAKDLSSYAATVNEFLKEIVNQLGYKSDVVQVARAVLDAYREEMSRGVIREFDRFEEVSENIMLGTFGVKPLSLAVAREALLRLNNEDIELEDKTVKILVNESEGVIRFSATPKRAEVAPTFVEEQVMPTVIPREVPVKQTAEVLEKVVVSELPPGFDVQDLSLKLGRFLDSGEVETLEFVLEGDLVKINLILRSPTKDLWNEYKSVVNMLRLISEKAKKPVTLELSLKSPKPLSELREILGDYVKQRRSPIDRLLPA